VASADHNLLFGILAVQMDFVSRDALIAAMNAWVLDKVRPLAEILVEQGALGRDRQALLEALVREHLRAHGDDPQKSLSAAGGVPGELAHFTDPDLQASLAATTPSTPPDQQATRTFAVGAPTSAGLRFHVLRPHARGGLGEVLVAYDEELHREVALKQILARHADEPDSRARFLQEAEITGRLEHPGVVPVYGLGRHPDGRPYYAMRFIRGESLKEAGDRFHRDEGPARDCGERGLRLRELLGRFAAACQAVAYAHSRGVVHRDLKPANIMLGPYGETLVVDWGLAKSTDQADARPAGDEDLLRPSLSGGSMPTQVGQAVGTPPFMSPEQAAGRLDRVGPASDVYSLGATLYALLTGRAPLAGSDVGAVLQKVQKGDFRRPRQVNPRVPAALEAVCLRAMALRPEARYASAGALAEDIARWLADEPVAAYREPLRARAARWARRHRAAVGGGLALLLTAVAALSVSTVLIWREEARTDEQRRRAEANFRRALGAVNDLLTEVGQEQLAHEPRMEKKRQALLAKAQEYYATFLQERGDDPALRKETALAYRRLADVDRLLGEHAAAERAYRQAITLLGRLDEERPQAEYRYLLAESFTYLGEVLRAVSRLPEAESAYQEAAGRLRDLLAGAPRAPDYRAALARVHYNLGILFKDSKRFGEAEKALADAVAALRGLAAEFPGRAEYRQHLARAYLNLGPVLRGTGRPERAEEVYRQAVGLQRALVDQDPDMPDYRYELAVTYNNLGFLRQSLGRGAGAEKAFRQALALFEKLVVSFPSVPAFRKELANARNNLAIALARGKDFAAAEDAWQQALAAFEKLAAEHREVADHQGSVGMVLGNLGWLRLQRDDPAGARKYLERAALHTRAALRANPRHPGHLQALRDQQEYLTEALVRLGAHAAAAGVARHLPEVRGDTAADYYAAARLLGRCVTAAEKDPTLAGPARSAAAAAYARQALDLLRQAVARGYRTPAAAQGDPFAPLRRYPELAAPLAELEARLRPAGR
jgi:serine/threonine-protein kinase